ncbi:MAG: hypothetical protein KGZ39_03830 [Simkania sp.]|nr:hypothetical protein [Simkania sp.]
MSLVVGFKEQALALHQEAIALQSDPSSTPFAIRGLAQAIDTLAQEILQTSPSEDGQQSLASLIRAKNILIQNSASTPESRLYINTVCPYTQPVIQNTAYAKPQTPTVSTYGEIAAEPLAIFRLAPTCFPLLPDALVQAIGPLDGCQVDLLSLVIDTRFPASCYGEGRPFNLNVHPWAHHDILPGWNVKKTISMGLFPCYNIYSANGNTTHKHPRPIELNALGPMPVHAHAEKDVKSPDAMLYSPDDAHFMIDPTCPFSLTWVAAHDGKRALISRLLMIHDQKDPIMEAIICSLKECRDLDEHLDKLSRLLNAALQKTFSPISENTMDPLTLFQSLPSWQKEAIRRQINILKEFPDPSFVSIDQLRSLTLDEWGQAITMHIEEMLSIFVEEHIQLLNQSAKISHLHTKASQILLTLGQKFEEEDPSALEEFSKLSTALKEQTLHAIWRLNGHPRSSSSFGSDRFASCDNKERAQAIYTAVTSQPLPKLEQAKLSGKEAPSIQAPLSRSGIVTSGVSEKLQQVLKAIPTIKVLNANEQAKQLHALFDTLTIDKETVKYPIYEELGALANKPLNQRREYGRSHFAADLDALALVIRNKIKALRMDGD